MAGSTMLKDGYQVPPDSESPVLKFLYQFWAVHQTASLHFYSYGLQGKFVLALWARVAVKPKDILFP